MSSRTLDLSTMAPPPGARTKKVRLGRGESSGVGKTAGRGGKGQKGRAGATIRRGFEGGQMPLYRRLPKLGFFSRKKVRGVNVYETISLNDLNKFESGATVDVKALSELGLVRSCSKVKLLSDGALTKKLTVKVHAVSKAAQEKVSAAGGIVELVVASAVQACSL